MITGWSFFFLARPAASSIESLDEVESSPHLPVVNRSRDSGLATSDQPLNDDSSEISEHVRRQTPLAPSDWTSSIVCGKGTVLTSIILPASISNMRNRHSKNIYKPSKQFLQREKLTNNTSDESDQDLAAGDSSVRSSTTTVNNMSISKIKRSKPISRHSSLGSSEYQYQQQQQQQNQSNNELKRVTTTDVKRTSSLKQFHHSSDEGDNNDELKQIANSLRKKNLITTSKKSDPSQSPPDAIHRKTSNNERRSRLTKSKAHENTKLSDEESMTTRYVLISYS